ncbi:DUF29 domain-containing protein [Azospirillum brasilense]|uniref:DUF29 domain-containing protein n=1 Tax=Azospirillum brasilense TaxID=192 RepID=A0A6L3B737_AZOBR|nr:DUF29 domain-containing protein [Azospirillum brasilense]KAA0688799.1 DUF29 domain-containing protein [Azospirillum brasilense]
MDSRIGYDDDFYAWTQEQARLLREAARERLNTPIDWDHVAEEIEGMGKSDRRAINSHLARVIEHLLKLEFSPAPDPRGGWRRSVREQRAAAVDALADSPSLKGHVDLDLAFRRGCGFASDGLGQDRVDERDLPSECPYALEQLLDEDWWPVNRHGLE